MNINAAELNAIKSLAVSQLTISRMGTFDGSTEIVAQTKRAKKVWWKTIRGRYRLDPNKKYSVELDGDKAGELRFKASGKKNREYAGLPPERRVVPQTASVVTSAASGDSTCADVVKAMNEAFAKANIAFEIKAK